MTLNFFGSILGFRLFSTSVPGQKADHPASPVRRRPAPSSRFFTFILGFRSFTAFILIHVTSAVLLPLSDSDSEMEMRLKEAAVPLKDLLPLSALPSTPTTETPSSETMLAHKVEKEGEIMKKKRKQSDEESEHVDSAPDHSSGERGGSELEHAHVQVKRKKKEKRKETLS